MEGVTGVVHPDDVEPGTASYAELRHLMTADVNAAVAGLFDDDVPTSEGRMNALVAAEAGVPVVLVTGDDRACADAEGYAPEAATAQGRSPSTAMPRGSCLRHGRRR